MTDFAVRFALIVDGLCRAVAARGARNRAAAPIFLVLWGRLRRMVKRFDSLVARLRAGHLPAPRPARGPRPSSPHKPDPLPRGETWLIRAVPEAAVYASQLRHLLTDPEIAALLAASPQAGRILRPLCHMLGIRPGPDTVPPPPPSFRPPPNPPSGKPDHLPAGSVPAPAPSPSRGPESSSPGTPYMFHYQNI